MRRHLQLFAAVCLVGGAVQGQDNSALLDRMRAMEDRIKALEAEVADLRGQKATPEAAAPAPQAAPPVSQAEAAAVAAQPGAGGNASAAANAKVFNPDIAVIGDFIGVGGKNQVQPSPALQMHES